MSNKIPWSEIRKSYGGGTEASESPNPFRRRKVEDYLQPETTEIGPWEDSWGKRLARAFTGLEDVVSAGAKSVGTLIQGRAAKEDELLNDVIRDIYEKSGREVPDLPSSNEVPRTVGKGFSLLGDYLFNRAHSPEREKAFNPNNRWKGTDLVDIITQGKLGDYLTDTDAGFLYEAPYNIGDMAGFLLPTKGIRGTAAIDAAGKLLNPARSLLGKLGFETAGDVIGSKTAKEMLGTGIQFGATMGPYGAMVNAGTMVDELKKQGKSDAEIADAISGLFAEELPADIAFAALTGNVIKGKLGNAIAPRGSSLTRKILANAAGIPLEMAGGDLSNVYQMILSEKYSGQPYGELFGERTEAEKEAGRMGAMAGLPFAIYGGGRGVVDARAADAAYERFQKELAESAPLREAALNDMPQMARDAYRDAQNEYNDANLRTWAQSQGVSDEVYNLAAKVAQEEGLPVERVIATIVKESNGDQSVISPAGAIGVMQLMPETAEALGVDPYDLEQNIRGGVRYLKQQYNKFGNWDLAHAAYNAGPGHVEKYGGIPPFAETQDYVAKINGYLGEVGSGEESGGDGRIGKPGYMGEGGKGENTYWVRNGNVNLDKAQPGLLDAIDMLGKKVYDDTGVQLVVTSGNDGGSHADGEHSHYNGWKVDIADAGANGVPIDADGVLFTKDFMPTEYCQQLIAYGRKLGLGMNLEAIGTSNVHLDVALDGTQWQGSLGDAGGFNPRNADDRPTIQQRADELVDQRFRERVSPQRQEQPQPPEPMQARQIDFKATDDETKSVFDGFAKEQANKAIADGDGDTALFFRDMFNGDEFQNTPENRAAIAKRYGDELTQFAQTFTPTLPQTTEQAQPVSVSAPRPQAQPAAGGTANKYIRNNDVIQAGNNFLEELRAKGTQADMATTVRLQAAISNGDTATVESILKANNRPVAVQQPQQPQQQTDPVKQNQTPENVLTQQQQQQQQEPAQPQQPAKPKKQPKTPEERAQSYLAKPIQGGKVKTRRKAGNAVIFLAEKNGIEIPDADRKSLENGKTLVINQWRDTLISQGILSPQATQSTPKKSSPAQSQPQQQAQPANKPLTLQERMQQVVNEAAQKRWEDVQETYRNRPEAKAHAFQKQSTNIINNLPTTEEGALRGDNNPEAEPYHVETLQEIRTREQRAREERSRRDNAYSDSESFQEVGAARGTINPEVEIPHVETLQGIKTREQRGREAEQEQQRRIDSYARGDAQVGDGAVQGRNDIEAEPYHVQTQEEIAAERDQIRAEQTRRNISVADNEANEVVGSKQGGNVSFKATTPKQQQKKPLTDEQLKEMLAKIKNAAYQSMEGDANTDIIDFVDDANLTPPHKILKTFSEKLGVPLRFFRNPDGKFHGAFSEGVTFLNTNSKKGLGDVFWHESFHWLKANNPQLYAKLVDAAGITPENRKAFLERTGRKDLKADEEIDEEILADQMDDVAKRTGLLQNIAGKNRGVVERVVQWLKDTMNKFIEAFRNPTGRLKTKQAQALAKEFGRIARQLKDENGNAIFRVNNRTGDIEVVGGRKARELSREEIEAAARSGNAKYSFVGEKAQTADLDALAEAKRMEAAGASKRAIYKKTNWIKGKDDKWRFEIEDDFDKMDFSKLQRDGHAKLGEIYDNEEMYAAHPDLRDMNVVAMENGGPRDDGYYAQPDDAEGEHIALDTNRKFGFKNTADEDMHDELGNTLVHEIQHAIQHREGFAVGGDATLAREVYKVFGKRTRKSDYQLYKSLGGEQEAHEVSARAQVNTLRKRLARENEEMAEYIKGLPKPLQKQIYDVLKLKDAGDEDAYFDAVDELEDEKVRGWLLWGGDTEYESKLEDALASKDYHATPQIHSKGSAIVTVDNNGEQYGQIAKHRSYHIADPNDNSSESWRQRVANFARAAIGLRRPAPERIHQKMKRQLSELSDLKIAAGHLPEGVQEKIDEVAKVIRTGKEYDWVKVLPAVGNAVAAQLGITQSAEMGNYIGKFLYGESSPDTSAEAQEFQEAMRKNEDMRDKILACRDTFSQWRNMSTEEQMIASMRFEEEQKPFRARAENFWKGFKTQFVESLTPVQSAVDAFEKRTGMKLDDVINPMAAFRLLRGMDGRAFRMIEGEEKFAKALQAALPNLNLDNWKTIRMILEPIGAFEDQKTREAFSAYVTACHVMDIHRQNNNNLKKQAETQSKIDALKDELKLAGNKKERARIEKSIERQEETLDSLKRNIKDIAEAWGTEEKCQTVINKYKDKFGAAQKELVDYSNTLLAMRVDAGLMTLERFNELLNIYPNYVPLHRVIDEVSGGDKADSMAHMAGSAKDIYDPIHAIMNNTFDTVRRCEKNKAKCLLATLARFDGVGKIFEEVENGNSDGTTITFYENGKMKHLQCSDETLVKAVNNLAPASMNWFIRALRIPTLILKGTATVLNVNFGARNVLRDSQDAYVYGAKHGGNVFKDIAKFMTPYAALKGAYDAFQMNDVFEEFMANGGAQSTFLTFDANYEQDAFDKLIKGKYKRFASAKGVLKLLETLGSYSELGTRLGRFEQVKGNLKEKHGGINIYGDLVSAALESRDLMDFARSGEAGRTMNALSAFANPAIQGWDKFFRTFDYKKLKRFGGTDETQRQWMTSAARLVIDSVVPALLLTLWHHDDDWYKKDVQDWEKETHWILSDTIRIPKPADVGARFLSNFTEKMMDWSLNNEPATFKKVFTPLWASLPDLLPTALQPVIECLTNYDMFRRSSIVPQRESKLPPELQYDSQSSNLAKFIGEKAGVSPRYIDHFIYGYTSNFGKGITRGMDTVAYKAGLSDRPPAFTRDWIPIIGGFLRVPYRNPKIVQDYYEALDKQESLLNGYKEHRKRDRNAKPSEEYDRALHARLKGAQNAMRALAAQERKVIEDQRLSSEEVDKRQREIQKRRVALCERVLGKAR